MRHDPSSTQQAIEGRPDLSGRGDVPELANLSYSKHCHIHPPDPSSAAPALAFQTLPAAKRYETVLTTPTADYLFICFSPDRIHRIEIRLRGIYGKTTPYGYVIDEIPRELQHQLSPRVLEEEAHSSIEKAIAAAIIRYDTQSRGAGLPDIRLLKPHSHSGTEIYRDANMHATLHSNLAMDLREWALDGTVAIRHVVSRFCPGGAVTLEQKIISKRDEDSVHEISCFNAQALFLQSIEHYSFSEAWTRTALLSSSEYACHLFARCGTDRVKRFLELSLESRIAVMRVTSIEELLAEPAKRTQRILGDELEIRPAKVPVEAPVRAVELENGVVVERHKAQKNALVIRAAKSDSAPVVIIGKPERSWADMFLINRRIDNAYNELISGDPARQRASVEHLCFKGFHVARATDKLSSPVLSAMLQEANRHSMISKPMWLGIHKEAWLELAGEMLNGREVLRMTNYAQPQAGFKELLAAVDRTGCGYLAIAAHEGIRFEFKMPIFPEDRDLSKLAQYCSEIVESFAASPSRAVQEMISYLSILSFPDLIDGKPFGKEPCLLFGDIGELRMEVGVLTAINTMLAVYSMAGLRHQVSTTSLRTALKPDRREMDEMFKVKVDPFSNVRYTLHFGRGGLDRVGLRIQGEGLSGSIQSGQRNLQPGDDPVKHAVEIVNRLLDKGSIRRLLASGFEAQEILDHLLVGYD